MYKAVAIAFLCLLLTSACDDPTSDETGDTQADTGSSDLRGWDDVTLADWDGQTSLCLGLSETACTEHAECVPLSGKPVNDDCSVGMDEYAGCWSGYEKEENGSLALKLCFAMPVYGRAPDSAQWFWFPEACVPDGWEMSEEHPYSGCAPR